MAKYFVVLILSLSLFAIPAHGQSSGQSRMTAANLSQGQQIGVEREAMSNLSSGSPQSRIEQTMMMHVVAERQAQLRVDTEKLVALTAELKQQLDRTNVNILSMDVIKKAQEIQKLAKSVQDKMKNAY